MVFSNAYNKFIPALRPCGLELYSKMKCEDFNQPIEQEAYAKRGKMWETPYAPSGPAFEHALSENLEIARLLEEVSAIWFFFSFIVLFVNVYIFETTVLQVFTFHYIWIVATV